MLFRQVTKGIAPKGRSYRSKPVHRGMLMPLKPRCVMSNGSIRALSVFLALALTSCASQRDPGATGMHGDAPADAFLAAIAGHCGQAFAGRIVANEPKPATPDA